MTTSRKIVEKIVEYWALGFSAEETVEKLRKDDGIRLSLHTVYNQRKSLTAKNLIDELIRTQQKSILEANSEDPALAMKYRDKLLEHLMPRKMEVESTTTLNMDEPMPWMADPELKKALLEEHERQKKEMEARAGAERKPA